MEARNPLHRRGDPVREHRHPSEVPMLAFADLEVLEPAQHATWMAGSLLARIR